MSLANLPSSKAKETTENFFKDTYFFFAALSPKSYQGESIR